MKKDIRVQYPLWNMTFIAILALLAFGIMQGESKVIHTNEEFMISLSLDTLGTVIVTGGILLYIISVIIFSVKIKRFNMDNPKKKINIFTFKPNEYIEEDEMFRQVTQRATQKVYTFFAWAIPLIVLLAIFIPFQRSGMIYILLGLGLMQNLIYYKEIRRYVEDEEE